MIRRLWVPMVVLVLGCETGPGPEQTAVSSALQPQAATETAPSRALGPISEAEFRDLVRRVVALLDQRRVDDARALCVEALDARPDEPRVTHLLAVVEMIAQNYESVVDLSTHQLKKQPDSVPLLATRATAHLYLQDIDASQRDILRAIERLEQRVQANAEAAKAETCGRSVEQALTEARVDLARTYYVAGDYDEAERIVSDLLERDPESTSVRFMQALVQSKRDDISGSMQTYQRILEEDSDCSACLNNLGVLQFRRHDLKAAREYFEKALHATPDWDLRGTALVLSNLAELDLLSGRFDRAEAGYREAIATASRYPGAHYGLAVLQDLRGRTGEARTAITQALLWDPQGLERHGYEYYEPEWKWYTEALVLEAQGQDASDLWKKVATGKVRMLREPARRHLAP